MKEKNKTRICFFWNRDLEEMQDDINQWLEAYDYEIFDIKYGHTETTNSAMIIYKT